jgi:phosphoglycerate dehydrogenase-like enzyme
VSESIVVAVLYPAAWYGSPDGFAAEVRAIEQLDERIVVEVVAYEESHERRTARGSEPPAAWPPAPELTAEQRELFARVDVVLAIDIPVDMPALAPNLRWVQAVGAGTAPLQGAGLAATGIRLTSNGGANSIAIAEFAFGRLLAAKKRFAELADAQVQQVWAPVFGSQLAGQTLGLIGYGPINQAVGRRAAAFGMTVLATRNRTGVPPEHPVDQFFGATELHAMLPRCDAIIAAAPETPATIGLLDADAFAAMRPGVFVCNVGRGSLIDEPALIAALRSGQVGAAALDVTAVEPLPAGDPLWDAPNLVLSSHCATAPDAMFRNLHRLFGENLRRYLAGESLLNEVESDRGY